MHKKTGLKFADEVTPCFVAEHLGLTRERFPLERRRKVCLRLNIQNVYL
jgi:hypothetical protein